MWPCVCVVYCKMVLAHLPASLWVYLMLISTCMCYSSVLGREYIFQRQKTAAYVNVSELVVTS